MDLGQSKCESKSKSKREHDLESNGKSKSKSGSKVKSKSKSKSRESKSIVQLTDQLCPRVCAPRQPLGTPPPPLSAKKVSENLEKVPRI